MANELTLGGGAATIGSMDPDNTAGLTAKVGAHNKVDKLMQRHAANWPLALVTALSMPVDTDRTEALDTDEVHEAISAIPGRKAFFDPETDKLVGVAVRGTTDGNRIVSVVFEVPSGRVGNGVIPYEGLPNSERQFRQLKADRFAEERGQVAVDAAGIPQGVDEQVAETLAAERKRADEAEQKAATTEKTLGDLSERLARLERPEPFPDYDTTDARDLVKKIEDGGVNEFGYTGLDRIEAYENSREKGPRKSVLDAIKHAATVGPVPVGDQSKQ